MKVKWLLLCLVVIIAGGLTGWGMYLFRDQPFPLWAIQAIILVSLLAGYFLYRKLVRPYQLLITGMELLREQDFTTTLHPVNNKEADTVIHLFNKMITYLRNERLAVREKNHFLDLLIQASPQGIIIMDGNNRITDINPAGRNLLRLARKETFQGKTLAEIHSDLATQLEALKPGDNQIIRGTDASVYRCIRSSFISEGFDHPFILVEELTREMLAVEKSAYEQLIRMMSHEVNNSVGAISSTLHVVSDIFRQENRQEWEDVLPALEASSERCGNLTRFISELAYVVKIPEPVPTRISLNEQIRTVEALTRLECRQRNIRLETTLTQPDQEIYADSILLEQVLVNLLKNAYESIGSGGIIRIEASSSPAGLIISDNDPGIKEEDQHKLFTPFFTTKPTGQGIGLMFIREVLVKHHFRFSLATEAGWTRFKIYFG
ncbi:MAG: ATP-binding protein [Tannerellaceae bacterium]|nr:ATP-binding protein [Tannerellaceae bacterium]